MSWNNICFNTSATWETTVQSKTHLVCEENLDPLFEIRWQQNCKIEPNYAKECEKIGCTTRSNRIPVELQSLNDSHKIVPYAPKGSKETTGLFFFCNHCSTLLHINIGCKDKTNRENIYNTLDSLSCHGKTDDDEYLLAIQDFSAKLPFKNNEVVTKNYSFKPGLSRIELTAADKHIHICRLSGAKERLINNNLSDILKRLCGVEELDIITDKDECFAHRTPTISKQIILRMKRQKPFLKGAIRYIKSKDRILVLLIESKKPISENDFTYTWQNYDLLS